MGFFPGDFFFFFFKPSLNLGKNSNPGTLRVNVFSFLNIFHFLIHVYCVVFN